jgi:hypothetical protein
VCEKKKIAASRFSEDVIDFLRLLHKYRVQYLIVGGEAVIFYGHARLTGDIDFFYGNSDENTENLYRALSEFWGGGISDIPGAEELQEPGIILQFGLPPNRIDLMNGISGVNFHDAWSRRVEVIVCDSDTHIPLYFLHKKDLIVNKKASGRPKDLDDIPYLEEK